MKLGLLTIGTKFTYKGRTLLKSCLGGPCDPETNKEVFPVRGTTDFTDGIACSPKMGGQFQAAKELQVWVPLDADVDVSID